MVDSLGERIVGVDALDCLEKRSFRQDGEF